MPLPKVKAPAAPPQQGATQQDLERPTAVQIYEQVARNGRRELARSNTSLAIAGIVGGLTMGLTGLSVAAVTAQLGHSAADQFIAYLLYPLGFMAVVLGRGQLFTENTLYPVALILAERRHYLPTLRLWAIVLATNVAGALLFAALCVLSGALEPSILSALAQSGVAAATPSASHIFWSAVMGGWIIALMAWLVSGSHSITGSVAIIWTLTFIVGLARFAHCIAGSGEVLSAVLNGSVTGLGYCRWLGLAASGNIVGGVFLVTLLEYGQSKLD